MMQSNALCGPISRHSFTSQRGVGSRGLLRLLVSRATLLLLASAVTTSGYGQSAAKNASLTQLAASLPAPNLHLLLAAAGGNAMKPAPGGLLQTYVGPGGCSAVACHGGIAPRSTTKVLQNEYSTWITEDKHARAYTVLTEPLARQMAATLKIGLAEKAERCLVCHAISAAADHRSANFEVSEGVSCESCHGPASAWIGPHIQPTARHADMVKLGLIDNHSLTVRTENCLSCHLGAAAEHGRPALSVDHAMIAAGHPDLTFELDSFTAIEPPHWIEKAPDQMAALNSPYFGVRAWGIGEAVQLRESMLRVARRAQSGPWPEFSEMDCITCHHPLTGPQSWRQQTGYSGHRAGDPPYNLARYIVFRHLGEAVDPALEHRLDSEMTRVSELITTMSPDRAAVESVARQAAATAGEMLAKVRTAQYNRALSIALIRSIAGDADLISREGERTAEQATMTVNSIYIANAKDGTPNPATRAAINVLFEQVQNPSAYNAPVFAQKMKVVATTLR